MDQINARRAGWQVGTPTDRRQLLKNAAGVAGLTIAPTPWPAAPVPTPWLSVPASAQAPEGDVPNQVLWYLQQLLALEQAKVQKGIIYALTQVVTSTVPQQGIINFPANFFAFTMTNDGPSAVQFRIPFSQQQSTGVLNATEVLTFSAIQAQFQSIALFLEAGGVKASVRIVGLT